MTAAHRTLYEECWDLLAAADPHVNLEDVDALFISRVTIDLDAAKQAACVAARREVDRARTKFKQTQLHMPMLAEPDEYIVTGDSERAQLAQANNQDMLASLKLSDENLKIQQDRNYQRHQYYYTLATYFSRGLLHNPAVEAYYRDHPYRTP